MLVFTLIVYGNRFLAIVLHGNCRSRCRLYVDLSVNCWIGVEITDLLLIHLIILGKYLLLRSRITGVLALRNRVLSHRIQRRHICILLILDLLQLRNRGSVIDHLVFVPFVVGLASGETVY